MLEPRKHPVSQLLPNSANVNQKRRERARLLISRINRLAKTFPEFRAILDEAQDSLNLQAARTPETDRALVLNAIHTGAWTMKDLIAETSLSRCEIQTILDRLVSAGIILRKPSEITTPLGGRPENLYIPAPTCPVTP